MHFITLGNTTDIGGSCHYLNLNGVGIVLDAGVDPEEEGRASLPELRQIKNRPDRPVHHVLISHAHHDHIGALPVLAADHPNVRIHLTPPTRHLAEVLLPSSARLQRRKLMEGTSSAPPLYDVDTAEAMSFLYQDQDLGEEFLLSEDERFDVYATFYHAGHTLGSAGILLEADLDDGPFRIFYTGDIHTQNQTILPKAELPEGPVDVLLLESTLGADEVAETTTRKEQEKELGEAIARVLSRGGSVLIPSFALGRAQEMLALVDRYKQRGLIPQETPVYTTGQMRAVADLFDQTRFSSPRIDPEFQVFGVKQKRTPRHDEGLRQTLSEPCIHIASSGMMFENTLSNALAKLMIPHEKHGIFFVGYSVDHSPGARLQAVVESGAEYPEIMLNPYDDEMQVVNAEVRRFRFSGHAHRQELLGIVEKLSPKKVILVHGETDAKQWMANAIAESWPDIEIVLPEIGQEVDL